LNRSDNRERRGEGGEGERRGDDDSGKVEESGGERQSGGGWRMEEEGGYLFIPFSESAICQLKTIFKANIDFHKLSTDFLEAREFIHFGQGP
jgi:hypothetical protein